MSLHRYRRRRGGCIVRFIKEEEHELNLTISSSTWHWDALVSLNRNDIDYEDSIKFYSLSTYPDLSSLDTTIKGNLQSIFKNQNWDTDDTNNYIYWFQCIYYDENNTKIGIVIFNLGSNGKYIHDNMPGYNVIEGTFHLLSNGSHAYNIRVMPIRHPVSTKSSINSRLTRMSLSATATYGDKTKTEDKRILSEWDVKNYQIGYEYKGPVGIFANPALHHALVTFTNGKIGSLSIIDDAYVSQSSLMTSAPIQYNEFYW